MAQAADYSLSSEDANQGKTSLLGKLKEKTKDKTNRLKTKLRSPSTTGDNNAQEDNTYASSDDEPEMAANNAVTSGVTQPEYERQLSDGQCHDNDVERSAATSAKNFPGNFAGIADDKVKTDSSLAKDFEGLSTKDTSEPMETQPSGESRNAEDLEGSRPMKQKIMDNASSAKDRTKNMITPNSAGSEQQYMSPDSAPASEQAQEVGDKATEAGRTWSQWAAERVGLAKDTASEKVGAAKETAAANAPTTAEGKPIHEEAYGTAVGAKDTAVEKATAAKDSVAAQMPDRSEIPSDPAEQTYGQKAAGGFYGAKDKLFTSTQPGDHDKALSQKVTDTVGNLPATIKSSFGFGGGASTPTTTPATSDAPLSSSTEEAPGAPPQSPGIVSRITGLFGGAKKPATDSSTPSEPAISETGPETQTPVSESTNMS
ncbi:unnamed protein product [Calypogeia fissa]